MWGLDDLSLNSRLIKIIPRTEDEIFRSWKASKPSTSWREYWKTHLRDHIRLYEKLGWKLICLGYDSKIPVKDVHWQLRNLSYENAYTLFSKKMNIGVNLTASKLIVIDVDSRTIPLEFTPFLEKKETMSAVSPHGYHIYFEYDVNEQEFAELAKNLNISVSMFRGGNNRSQYTVLPPSHVERKYYEWLCTDRLMKFSECSG